MIMSLWINIISYVHIRQLQLSGMKHSWEFLQSQTSTTCFLGTNHDTVKSCLNGVVGSSSGIFIAMIPCVLFIEADKRFLPMLELCFEGSTMHKVDGQGRLQRGFFQEGCDDSWPSPTTKFINYTCRYDS